MNRTSSCLFVTVVAASLAALVACDEGAKPGDGTGSAAPATSDAAAPASGSASAAPAASSAPSADASAEPAPSADASATPSAAASAEPAPTASGGPAPSASAEPTGKQYDCGGKGQKACPMQGWMKGVMGGAMQSGDNDKIAQALNTIAAKVPAGGYGQWSAIAAEGAAKAKAGDIDGAKESCKKCHALYQKKYKDNQRDQPW